MDGGAAADIFDTSRHFRFPSPPPHPLLQQQQHRPSKSSSDSREFEFMSSRSACVSPYRSFPHRHDQQLISPADELFYNGKLLPLYQSEQRILKQQMEQEQQVLEQQLEQERQQEEEEEQQQQQQQRMELEFSSSSRDSACSSSRDSSAASDESVFSSTLQSVHKKVHHHRKEADADTARWKIRNFFSKEHKARTPAAVERQQQQQQQQDPSRSHGSLAKNGRPQTQNLAKAKDFWKRFFKPMVNPSSKVLPRPQQQQEQKMYHQELPSSRSRSFFSGSLIKPSGSLIKPSSRRSSVHSSTPLASPLHSGPSAPAADSSSLVQSAIAYCKQTQQRPAGEDQAEER